METLSIGEMMIPSTWEFTKSPTYRSCVKVVEEDDSSAADLAMALETSRIRRK
jgi:hypothetical protein